MRYSVSAVCLRGPLWQRIARIDRARVADLHCDVFDDEVAHADGLSVAALRDCFAVWPARITLHVWHRDPVAALTGLPGRPGDRVIVELHRGLADVPACLSRVRAGGWRVGVGVRPEYVDAVELLVRRCRLDAVQLLTTTRPGRIGGEFRSDAVALVRRLLQVRRALGQGWSVEADGGISATAMAQLKAAGCELAVLGSNYLRAYSLDEVLIRQP